MNAPPEGAELFDYEGVPVSRLASDLAERFLTLVWTPDPKPTSPQTASRAALEGWPIDRADFDRLRRSYGRLAESRKRSRSSAQRCRGCCLAEGLQLVSVSETEAAPLIKP